MKCAFPRVLPAPLGGGDNSYPCGRCMPCRLNLKQRKTARFLLEAIGQEHRGRQNSFATLTLSDENMDYVNDIDGVPRETLKKERFKRFMYRCRKHHFEPFRFAAVGEYGDKDHRPHYHILGFGLSAGDAEALYTKCWTAGFIHCTEFIPERAAYLAGYTIKKMTQPDDPRLSLGQVPEFFRQSLQPGIGALPATLDYLQQLHETKGGAQVIAETSDVNPSIRIAGKIYPLDNYLKIKLRERLNIPRTHPDRDRHLVPEPLDLVLLNEQHHDKLKRRYKRGVM